MRTSTASTPVDPTSAETVRVDSTVLAPLVIQGAVIRRPRATAWAEQRQTDRPTTFAVLRDSTEPSDWRLVTVSAGPVSCPGRYLVLLVASQLLSRLATQDLRVARGRYLARDPLPATMDHLGLRSRLAA
ncbi:hypothetical protein ACQEVI_03550 [Promicromonospora sp. CA-289599]|uniref:hypothetical protein n=1 Tax=Promicromonospora sp. CA-289599 TaxID=3240014 RepID=UPI003D944FC9